MCKNNVKNGMTYRSTRQLVSRISSINSMIDDILVQRSSHLPSLNNYNYASSGEMVFSQRKRPHLKDMPCFHRHVERRVCSIIYQRGFAMQIDIQLQNPLVDFQIRAFTCLCSIGSSFFSTHFLNFPQTKQTAFPSHIPRTPLGGGDFGISFGLAPF